jgi:drug/metabolite transporter (DMT)-like permease
MALLATPSLGLLISALTLHETVSISLATGIILIAGGIRLATLDTLVARSGTGPGRQDFST